MVVPAAIARAAVGKAMRRFKLAVAMGSPNEWREGERARESEGRARESGLRSRES
jgi:hypothetical protein